MSAFIQEAEQLAKFLVRKECRFPGDQESAMRRVASKARVSFGLIWSLHYDAPKTLDVDKYAALWELFADEKQQRTKYAAEREETMAVTWLGKALMRAADRLGGQDAGAVSDGE